jgi:hypothetical protein
MKCFVIGFAGAVLGMVLSMFLGAQYANRMVGAQTESWLRDAGGTVAEISRNIERLHGVSGAGTGVVPPRFSEDPPAMSLVTLDGAILLQGGYKGQAIVLVPAFDKGKVAWSCVSGASPESTACAGWHGPQP